MANPEGVSGVGRTIEDGNAVVNSGSVVNRTDSDAASDTEQYGSVDISGQRMGSKKKACFQITNITNKRNATENDANMDDVDSNDELDESRLEDYSSSELVDSFNVSRNSISDLEQVVADGGIDHRNVAAPPVAVPVAVSASTLASAEEQTNSSSSTVPPTTSQANGNGPHRFKVVKVATEPIRKGRWTCRDFPSETKNINQTTPESLRNQDSSKEAVVHSGNSSTASSVHYIHGQDNNAENPLAQGDEISKTDLSRKISSTSSKDVGNKTENDGDDAKDEKLGLEQLKDGLQEHASESSEGDDGTSPAGGAIDNKIEQAMDLVKSHLLFAVREEVEVLKEQIKILVKKNENLQEENSMLKQRLQQPQPPPSLQQPGMTIGNQQQGINMPTPQQQQQPPQQGLTIQGQQGTAMSGQEQPAFSSLPNQMGQNPLGQTMSDHAAYPQHPIPAQTHSTPNPGVVSEATTQYTPQGGIDTQGGPGQFQGMTPMDSTQGQYHSQTMPAMDGQQGQYQSMHAQMHIGAGAPGMTDMQYSQVGASTQGQSIQQGTQPMQQSGQMQTTQLQQSPQQMQTTQQQQMQQGQYHQQMGPVTTGQGNTH